MSDTKEMNVFLKNATRQEVDSAVSEIILTERQKKVFNLYFINKEGRELHSGHAVRKPKSDKQGDSRGKAEVSVSAKEINVRIKHCLLFL